MSDVAIIVPVKATIGAKQRLGSSLPENYRRLLALAMASDVLRVIGDCAGARHIVVVTGDPDVEQLARRSGMAVVNDNGGGQSDAVRRGIAWAREIGCAAAVTVSADCPLVTVADVEVLCARASDPGGYFVCVPDAEGSGTNAAALRPLNADVWRFGPDSLRHHRLCAERRGLEFAVVNLPSLRVDCDRIDDVLLLQSTRHSSATYHFLQDIAIVMEKSA